MLGGIGVEIQQVADFGALGQLLGNSLKGRRAGQALGVEELIGIFERTEGFRAESVGMAADSHGVETAHHEVFHTHRHHVGRRILAELSAAADHREGADMGELENGGGAANDGVVLNDAFAGDLDAVGHDDVVTQHASVGNVAIGHDQAIGTDHRFGTVSRALVDGGTFADDGAGADLHIGSVAGAPFQILRLRADAGLREDLTFFAQSGVALYGGVMAELYAPANHGIRADVRKRTNLGLGVDLGTFTDERKRMDGHEGLLLLVFGNKMAGNAHAEDHWRPNQHPCEGRRFVGQCLREHDEEEKRDADGDAERHPA